MKSLAMRVLRSSCIWSCKMICDASADRPGGLDHESSKEKDW